MSGPRACGDDPWGCRSDDYGQVVDPAHAGMILKYRGDRTQKESGPRACGDDPHLDAGVIDPSRWTPRMRG